MLLSEDEWPGDWPSAGVLARLRWLVDAGYCRARLPMVYVLGTVAASLAGLSCAFLAASPAPAVVSMWLSRCLWPSALLDTSSRRHHARSAPPTVTVVRSHHCEGLESGLASLIVASSAEAGVKASLRAEPLGWRALCLPGDEAGTSEFIDPRRWLWAGDESAPPDAVWVPRLTLAVARGVLSSLGAAPPGGDRAGHAADDGVRRAAAWLCRLGVGRMRLWEAVWAPGPPLPEVPLWVRAVMFVLSPRLLALVADDPAVQDDPSVECAIAGALGSDGSAEAGVGIGLGGGVPGQSAARMLGRGMVPHRLVVGLLSASLMSMTRLAEVRCPAGEAEAAWVAALG